ncbi:DUF1576 domain-containing protein [Schnuerera sp. xch1]|uniref:DUF1576 domain-containing protein n=1 Tax=Schnuerera sp. xch1 TaxID=2874283 RepID=UPI001CBFCA33|nr:DUF1576 domain-containing protein [Schnuerera sp. xch1]MBZ2175319.1 DUF1576 domain-containing protein [Schnuerera sp. xch1]
MKNRIKMFNGMQSSLWIIIFLSLSFIILAFILESPRVIINGLYKIIIVPDILLTDYIAVGGIGAAFFNVGLMGLINSFLLYKFKIHMDGLAIAAAYTVMGFSFIGKNIFNFWPIYFGGYIYSRFEKIEYRKIFLIMMFATTLSPVVSEIAFGTHLSRYIGIFTGILIGIIIGLIIVPLSAQMMRFHDGFNLYNIGFTGGVLGTLITSILRSFGLIIETQNVLSNEYSMFLCIILVIVFILLIILGYRFDPKKLKGYKKIFQYSGRTVTDFVHLVGYGATLVNMGIMGLICIIFVIISGGTFNGPILAGILTVVGFSAFGKHPKNVIPIFIGIMLASGITIWDRSSTLVIIAGLFGTTLAPVAGKYGLIAGIITGGLHFATVMNVGMVHGGINLYNNGFAGGIVAGIIVPVLNIFKEGE